MIRYKKLQENRYSHSRGYQEDEETGMSTYDIVDYAGHKWYIIDMDDDTFTLLSKYTDFGESIFDEKSKEYKTSYIRKYLNSKILSDLISKGANPLPTRLDDVGVTDKVWLLGSGEVPSDIEVIDDSYYWTRSRNDNRYLKDCASIVQGLSPWYTVKKINSSSYIRPVIRIRKMDLFR